MKVSALALSVLAALVAAGLSSAAPQAADPKTMVLQPADLPAGWERVFALYVSNAQAARAAETKRNYARLGRLRGYRAIYGKAKNATRGFLSVVSEASTYKTAAGARETMALDIRDAEATTKPIFRRLPLARIGDEARLYTETSTESGIKLDGYVLVWRSGTVYASLSGGARAGTAGPSLIVTLAKRQQARIARG